jgi:hypothetical protein
MTTNATSAYQQQWYVNILNTYYPPLGILTPDNIAFPMDMIQNQVALFTAILPNRRHSRTVMISAASPRPRVLV